MSSGTRNRPGAGRVAIYAREAPDAAAASQVDQVRAAIADSGCEPAGIYVDEGHAGAQAGTHLPALQRLLADASRAAFDLVAIASLDQLGGSVPDLHRVLSGLRQRGIHLQVLEDGLDTRKPTGKSLLRALQLLERFDQRRASERVRVGLARERASGHVRKPAPRRPRLDADRRARILELRSQGLGILKVAGAAQCGVSTVLKVLAESRAGHTEARGASA